MQDILFQVMVNMTIIADLLGGVSDVVTGVIDIFIDLFADGGVVAIFWDETDGLTLIAYLLLLAFGFGLVRWGFGFVVKLIRMRK